MVCISGLTVCLFLTTKRHPLILAPLKCRVTATIPYSG